MLEIRRDSRLSQALVHFVIDRASLFSDHRISGRPIRANLKHFRAYYWQFSHGCQLFSCEVMVVKTWNWYFVEFLSRVCSPTARCARTDGSANCACNTGRRHKMRLLQHMDDTCKHSFALDADLIQTAIQECAVTNLLSTRSVSACPVSRSVIHDLLRSHIIPQPTRFGVSRFARNVCSSKVETCLEQHFRVTDFVYQRLPCPNM